MSKGKARKVSSMNLKEGPMNHLDIADELNELAMTLRMSNDYEPCVPVNDLVDDIPMLDLGCPECHNDVVVEYSRVDDYAAGTCGRLLLNCRCVGCGKVHVRRVGWRV